MKRLATFSFVLAFAGAGSTAFAEQTTIDQVSVQAAKSQPVLMTEAQMDNVAGGQMVQIGSGLVTVQVGDVTVTLQDIPIRILNNSVNDNTVQVPVNANVSAAVALLGNASSFARQFGRQF